VRSFIPQTRTENQGKKRNLTNVNRTQGDRFAGNGGLSLRRVSAIKKVLSFQARLNSSDAEDEWFGRRVVVMEDLKVANGHEVAAFSVEDIPHDSPMGYHVREGGRNLPDAVWKTLEQRKKIFEYCPELTMLMDMKLDRERCEGDKGDGVLPEKKEG
jgi:hypothetical protein